MLSSPACSRQGGLGTESLNDDGSFSQVSWPRGASKDVARSDRIQRHGARQPALCPEKLEIHVVLERDVRIQGANESMRR